jgi:predicted MFS family arabinose efflux permease
VPDRTRIYAASFLRATAVGATGVFAAIYLRKRGIEIGTTGLIIGAGMAGAAVGTAAVGLRVDLVVGRRRFLVLLAILSALGYAAIVFPVPASIVVVLAFAGMFNGMGRDRGGLAALEQAVLPETMPAGQRTWGLAWYNLLLDLGHALGSLGGGLPALVAATLALSMLASYHIVLAACAALLLCGAFLYAGLSPGVEPVAAAGGRRPPISPETRRAVRSLAVLFAVDSIGGGFLSSALVAYWFFEQYGLPPRDIAVLFFAARGLNALSHLAAAWLARRIGLVNTMVFTHLPSSVLLMIAPATPSAALAAAFFLAREALVEMDVPTRQSYVMAIVRPEERSYASGVTNLARNLGWAAGPALAGLVMQHVAISGPLFIGGGLKIAYDLLLYRSFRRLRAPEEHA